MKQFSELFSLEGKVALVTGATGYLGSAIVYGLAEAGAHVLVNSRSEERCRKLVDRVVAAGYSAESAVFNVTSEQAIESFFSSSNINQIDIIVNNAYSGGSGNVESSELNDYIDSYSVTMLAAHMLVKQALPFLRHAVRKFGQASVINIGSMYGMVSPDQRLYETAEQANPPFYGAAKAALLQWTRYAACEFGRENIRINSLSPGPFPSHFVKHSKPNFVKQLSNKVPLGRVGNASEIVGPAIFLASEASSFVNGANIVVDGGWTSW